MFDALRQSLGKMPNQRLLLIGTRAPAPDGSWWPDLLDAGCLPGIHVTVLSADPDDPWDDWKTIKACNPMITYNKTLAATIKRERNEARVNPSMKKSFLAFRLNRQIQVSAEMLLSIEDYQRLERRPVPPRQGRPIVALDLGGQRSWSAAWAAWPNGRCEAFACCGGIPDLEQRERQDGMTRGLYTRLNAQGVLVVDPDVRVARPETLIDFLLSVGIHPEYMICDRFLIGSLKDVVAGRWEIVPRVVRWSEATEDIAGFRKLAIDGPLSLAPESRDLVKLSLSQAIVINDDGGSMRLKKNRHGRSRDDVAVCATLASGALARRLQRQPVDRPLAYFVA